MWKSRSRDDVCCSSNWAIHALEGDGVKTLDQRTCVVLYSYAVPTRLGVGVVAKGLPIDEAIQVFNGESIEKWNGWNMYNGYKVQGSAPPNALLP